MNLKQTILSENSQSEKNSDNNNNNNDYSLEESAFFIDIFDHEVVEDIQQYYADEKIWQTFASWTVQGIPILTAADIVEGVPYFALAGRGIFSSQILDTLIKVQIGGTIAWTMLFGLAYAYRVQDKNMNRTKRIEAVEGLFIQIDNGTIRNYFNHFKEMLNVSTQTQEIQLLVNEAEAALLALETGEGRKTFEKINKIINCDEFIDQRTADEKMNIIFSGHIDTSNQITDNDLDSIVTLAGTVFTNIKSIQEINLKQNEQAEQEAGFLETVQRYASTSLTNFLNKVSSRFVYKANEEVELDEEDEIPLQRNIVKGVNNVS